MSKNKKKDAMQIWNMLDELSAKDPEAYRNFIKDQLNEGKKITAPPIPQLLIRLKTSKLHYFMQKDKNQYVYILFCSWSRIPDSEVNETINILPGNSFMVEDFVSRTNLETHLYPLAFCDKVAKELSNEKLTNDQLNLIDMAIDYIDKNTDVKVDLNDVYEICSSMDILKECEIHKSFNFKPFNAEQEIREVINTGDDNIDLLDQIKCSTDEETGTVLNELKMPSNEHMTDKTNMKKVIIEEIDNPVNMKQLANKLKVEIRLADVDSIKEIELDVSEKSLHLEIPKKKFKPITLDFPKPISVQTVESRFKRKSNLLCISADYK